MSTDRAPATIGVDIGGSRIRAGVVTGDGRVVAARGVATPGGAHLLQGTIAGLIGDLAAESAADHDVRGVGLAVAGFIAADRATVMFAPHLPWRQAPVPRLIADAVQLPVVMDHDVNCAAWAEHRLGAAAGADISLTIALGTGIGAGLVINSRLYRGAGGVAPEIGHLVVVPDGRRCPCGKRGCLERYCSGTALAADYAGRAAGGAAGPVTRRGGMTGADVARAARDGDPAALGSFADLARWLGAGLAIACDVFDPEVIVIAGGVSESADLYLGAARAEMAAQLTGAGYRPEPRLVRAHFGSAAAVVGAALLAAQPGG